MANDQQLQHRHNDVERNAYNAAFYELGLRWHWDSDTYDQLLSNEPEDFARLAEEVMGNKDKDRRENG